jgi:predicted ATPase
MSPASQAPLDLLRFFNSFLGRLGRELGTGKLAAVLHQHAPTWLVQLPGLVDTTARGELHRQVAGATQERMLRELCDALEVLTAMQPLLLVLEDLQWSDTATLGWLAAVARRPDPAPAVRHRDLPADRRDHPGPPLAGPGARVTGTPTLSGSAPGAVECR